MSADLRQAIVEATLMWERRYAVAPAITSVLSEFDAASILGCSPDEYSLAMQGRTAVSKGYDFSFRGVRYQVKGNRPSGKPGSFVTLVPKPKNFDWDRLIWILYDTSYNIQEAWEWEVEAFRNAFENRNRLSPNDMRRGKKLT